MEFATLKAESGQKWLSSKVQNFIENMFFKILIIDCKRKKKKKIWKKTDFRLFEIIYVKVRRGAAQRSALDGAAQRSA